LKNDSEEEILKAIRRISIPLVILLVLCGIYFGVIRFNLDTIDNYRNHRVTETYPSEQILFDGWSVNEDGELSGGTESFFRIQLKEPVYVHNIWLNGSFQELPPQMKVYYTEAEGEPFSEEKSFYAEASVKNRDYELRIQKEVCSLKILPLTTNGAVMELSGVTVNPHRIHIQSYIVFGTAVPAFVWIFFLQFRFSLREYLKKFRQYLPLVGNLVSRDLKVKYRRSVLGYLWSILNPLLMALVIHTVFSNLFRFQVPYFATYYLVGSLIFNFVIDCTSNGLMSVISAAPLIKKVYVPKYVFPLQKCAFAFVNMLFGVVAVLVVMVIQGVPFHWTMLLFFVPMIYAFVFAYGVSLILSTMAVFFRDIQYLYSVFTQVWMYLTPIIYPEEVLLSTKFAFVMRLNPMYYYTHALRSVVMYGTLPSLNENICCISFALLALLVGTICFKKKQDRFILYI